MELRNWVWTQADQALADKWMRDLPEKMLDVHAHIYRMCDLGKQFSPYIHGPDVAGHDIWKECVQRFVGTDKKLSAIHVAPPCETAKEIEASNAFVLSEVEKNPDCKALVLISPEMGRERVEKYLDNPNVVGMKPFSYYAHYDGPSGDAPLDTYLPEWAWQCAHDHGLMFLVHLMRSGSLADPLNYEEIRRMAKKYPNARLMLDHCARGFNVETVAAGIEYVKDLPNVYFDTSSICEVMPMYTVLKRGGLDRVVFGTDFPLTQMRGRSLTIGDGFIWLNGENVDWESYTGLVEPVQLGIENIRALQQTMEVMNLSKMQKENLFYNNAMEMISGRK